MVHRRGLYDDTLPLDLNDSDVYQVPAFVIGVALGPVGTKFLSVDQWGGEDDNKKSEIAYVWDSMDMAET